MRIRIILLTICTLWAARFLGIAQDTTTFRLNEDSQPLRICLEDSRKTESSPHCIKLTRHEENNSAMIEFYIRSQRRLAPSSLKVGAAFILPRLAPISDSSVWGSRKNVLIGGCELMLNYFRERYSVNNKQAGWVHALVTVFFEDIDTGEIEAIYFDLMIAI